MDKLSQSYLRETRVLDCPKCVVGRVIGKNGETIKALQIYTGALIQIDQTMEPMKINITGTQPNLNLAVSMTYDIIHRNFKGFALLRQIATSQNSGIDLRNEALASLPVYSPGYGFIPPSQTKRQPSPDDNINLEKLRELETLQQALSQLQVEGIYKNLQGANQTPAYRMQNSTSNGTSLNLQKAGTQSQQLHSLLPSTLKNLQNVSQGDNQFCQDLNPQNLSLLSQNYESQKLQQEQLLQNQALNYIMNERSQGLLQNMGEINTQLNTESMPLSFPTSGQTTPPETSNDNWSLICDPDGKLFYFNKETGETSWSNPFQTLQNQSPFQQPTKSLLNSSQQNRNQTGVNQAYDMIFNTSKLGEAKDTEIFSVDSQNSHLSGYSHY